MASFLKRRWSDRNRNRQYDQGDRGWSYTAKEAKGYLGPPKAGRGKEGFSYRVFRGSVAPLSLWFLLVSRAMREYILCCFKSPNLWPFVTAALGNQYIWPGRVWTRAWSRFSDSKTVTIFILSSPWIHVKKYLVPTTVTSTTQWHFTSEVRFIITLTDEEIKARFSKY